MSLREPASGRDTGFCYAPYNYVQIVCSIGVPPTAVAVHDMLRKDIMLKILALFASGIDPLSVTVFE